MQKGLKIVKYGALVTIGSIVLLIMAFVLIMYCSCCLKDLQIMMLSTILYHSYV